MWIELESSRPVNLDNVTNIEVKHSGKTATPWASGVVIGPDSEKLYALLYPKGEMGGFVAPAEVKE